MTRTLSTGLLLLMLASPPASAQIHSTLVGSGFTTPIAMVKVPGMANTFLVAEQGGRIRVLQNGSVLPTDFLNLIGQITSGGEQGLLGLAIAPDYATSGKFWVNFTDPSGNTVIARFTRSAANPLVANAASRVDLMWPGPSGLQGFINQPFANHNGGNIMFGPDGFLYIGMGDGGSGNDPDHNAQNPASLLGKMLRIDVMGSSSTGYSIPPTNPFVGVPGYLPEIWDVGMRNPWRWSFDSGNGALVIGDVGQNAFEEVDYEPAGHGGRNYGWRNREGAHDNVVSRPPAFLPLIDPIWEYGRSEGVTVTGGYVYRGAALGSAYVGRYFFADFGFGKIWSLALTIDPVTHEATASSLVDHTSELSGIANPSSFAADDAGELYILSYGNGRVYRIDAGGPASPPPPANGCLLPDPFTAMGGGTCFNGGWYPPTVTAPPPAPPAPPAPPVSGGCLTPDPFVVMGGGVCVNGGWFPPSAPAPPAPTPTPTPTPTPPPPPSSGGCLTPNPFAAFGMGVCVNGGWQFAPATSPAPTPTPTPTPPPSSSGCTTPDPFSSIPGLQGVCVNGGWYPVIR